MLQPRAGCDTSVFRTRLRGNLVRVKSIKGAGMQGGAKRAAAAAMDKLNARTKNLERFHVDDRPVIKAFLDAYADGTIKLSAQTVTTHIESLYHIGAKCAAKRGVVHGMVARSAAMNKVMMTAFASHNGSTYLTRMKAIIALLRHMAGFLKEIWGQDKFEAAAVFWRTQQSMADELVEEARQNNLVTDKMREGRVTMDELKTAATKAAKVLQDTGKGLSEHQAALLVVLAYHVPPKRINYNALRIVRSAGEVTDDENAIVVPADPRAAVELRMNDYKTAKAYKQHEEALSPAATTAVRASLKGFPRSHLFMDNTGKPYTKPAYGMFLKRSFEHYTGQPVSNNALRRAWVMEYADPTKYTVAERASLAKSMQHSMTTQVNSYFFVDRPAN